jgi:hypothetical protein
LPTGTCHFYGFDLGAKALELARRNFAMPWAGAIDNGDIAT